MRTIDELGISPTPWCVDRWNDINDTGGYTIASVMDSEGCDKAEEAANARLIAAAPELYETLSDAVNAYCSDCEYCSCNPSSKCTDTDNTCQVRRWRSALAKASGEEVSK